MKHYEDVWLYAENVSAETLSVEDCLKNISIDASDLDLLIENGESEKLPEVVGRMIFSLARICKEYDINSWKELKEYTDGIKIDQNDETEYD